MLQIHSFNIDEEVGRDEETEVFLVAPLLLLLL